jgi:hypothetical protein
MIRLKSLSASYVKVFGVGASKSLELLKSDSGVGHRVKKRSFKQGNRPRPK